MPKTSSARFRKHMSGGSLLLAVLIGVGASVWLPEIIAEKTYQGDDSERFTRTVEQYRAAILELCGGFVLVLALKASLTRSAGFERTAKASARALRRARHAQTSENMIKALALLNAVDSSGNKQIEVRLGAIYALARIAEISAEDHPVVTQILASYLRRNSIKCSDLNSCSNENEDLQTAITVLGRRQYKLDRTSLNLQAAFLTGADLRGGHFEDANLTGSALDGAAMTEAHLEGAILAHASLCEAQLTDAHLEGADLTRTNLAGTVAHRASLQRVTLTDACLDGATFTGAQLQKADLKRASLRGAKLTGAQLQGACLADAKLDNADLTRASLHGANLAGVVDLAQKQIDSAYGDHTTQLPTGFDYPPYWSHSTTHFTSETISNADGIDIGSACPASGAVESPALVSVRSDSSIGLRRF